MTMRVIGEGYDGDLNLTSVIVEEDGREYWLEVVRHGRWIRMNDGFTKWQCSACGIKYHDICWNFCPHCGAKMDGKEG